MLVASATRYHFFFHYAGCCCWRCAACAPSRWPSDGLCEFMARIAAESCAVASCTSPAERTDDDESVTRHLVLSVAVLTGVSAAIAQRPPSSLPPFLPSFLFANDRIDRASSRGGGRPGDRDRVLRGSAAIGPAAVLVRHDTYRLLPATSSTANHWHSVKSTGCPPASAFFLPVVCVCVSVSIPPWVKLDWAVSVLGGSNKMPMDHYGGGLRPAKTAASTNNNNNKRPPLLGKGSAGCCLMQLDPHYSSSRYLPMMADEGTYVCKAFSPRSYVIQKVSFRSCPLFSSSGFLFANFSTDVFAWVDARSCCSCGCVPLVPGRSISFAATVLLHQEEQERHE